MTYQNSPSCDCCDDCTILSDGFDGSGSDMGSDWIEERGNWSRSSGVATVSSTLAILRGATSHGLVTAGGGPGTANYDQTAGAASVDVSSTSDGDKLHLIACWLDQNDSFGRPEQHYAIELEVGGSAALRITYIEGEGSSQTHEVIYECSVTAAANTTYKLGFEILTGASGGSTGQSSDLVPDGPFESCAGDTLIALLDDVVIGAIRLDPQTPTLETGACFFGIGTGDTLSGTPSFDNFLFDDRWEAANDDEECGRNQVVCGWPPERHVETIIRATLSGDAADTSACSDCNSQWSDAVFILIPWCETPGTGNNWCLWRLGDLSLTQCQSASQTGYVQMYSIPAARDEEGLVDVIVEIWSGVGPGGFPTPDTLIAKYAKTRGTSPDTGIDGSAGAACPDDIVLDLVQDDGNCTYPSTIALEAILAS